MRALKWVQEIDDNFNKSHQGTCMNRVGAYAGAFYCGRDAHERVHCGDQQAEHPGASAAPGKGYLTTTSRPALLISRTPAAVSKHFRSSRRHMAASSGKGYLTISCPAPPFNRTPAAAWLDFKILWGHMAAYLNGMAAAWRQPGTTCYHQGSILRTGHDPVGRFAIPAEDCPGSFS